MKRKFIISFLFCFATALNVLAQDPDLTPSLEKNTKNYIVNVGNQIEDLKNTIADDFGDDFVNYCIVLICIGAIFHVGMKIIKSLQKGNLIDLNTLILPFMFIFIVCSYRPITNFVDYTTNGFQYFISAKCDNIDNELNALRDEKINLARRINEKIYQTELEKAEGRLFKAFWAWVKKEWRTLQKWFTMDYIVGYFFLLLLFVSAFLIRIVGGILGVILYLIGPFSIAVSVIPIFKDSWKTWLTTYIWVQLFSPIAQIISYILANLEKNSLLIDINRMQQIYENYAEHLSEPISENFYSGLTYIAFMCAGVVMYWCVPTISGWLIPAQGGGTLSVLSALASKSFAGGMATLGKGKSLGIKGLKRLNKLRKTHSNNQGVS